MTHKTHGKDGTETPEPDATTAATAQAPARQPDKKSVTLRPPRLDDGAAVFSLIDNCKPLDLNSRYAYLMLCSHFAQTCAVGEIDGKIAAFASAYCPPGRPDVLFVWQVAVGQAARGQGVAKRLLLEILRRPACSDVRFIEATITPDNKASWALFRALARDLDAPLNDEVWLTQAHFGGSGHDAEHLLAIGPFDFNINSHGERNA